MEVILDSNTFLNHHKLSGPQFAELFAYLKRTGSNLVIPSVVLEEVSERYKDRLKSGLNAANRSWLSFAEIRMSPHPQFPHIDFDEEVKKLQERLLNPSPGVKTLQYSDVSDIDVNEIARRGTKRLRPASQNGEELRDVILWLSVLQYARKSNLEVAFVSGDNGFRETKDKNDLHPELAMEVANAKLPVHFYRDIPSFLMSQSLGQETIEEDWLPKYVNSKNLAEQIAKAISKIETNYGLPAGASIERLEFSGGTAYKISAESRYVELQYRGRAKLTFQLPSLTYVADLTKAPENLMVQDFPRVSGIGARTVYRWKENADVLVIDPPFSSPTQRMFDFQTSLSARIEGNQQLVHWQVDQVDLVEVSE
jgi:PIN domain